MRGALLSDGRERKLFLLAAFTGAALNVVLLAGYISSSPFALAPMVDSRYYWLIATETAVAGKPLPAVFFGAPLYPLFLAGLVRLFGPVFWPVYVAQAGLCLTTVFLLHFMVKSVAGKSAARWATVLLLFNAPFAFQALKILPDTLGFFLLALFLALGASEGRSVKKAALSGLLAGIMVLCRTQLLLPVLAVEAFEALRPAKPGRRLLPVVTVLVLAASLFPFALYTQARTGRLTPFPPNSGLALLEGNNPAAAGTYARVVGDEDRMENRLADMTAKASGMSGRRISDPYEADAVFRARAMAFMAEDPARFVTLLGKKALLLFSPLEKGDVYNMYVERRHFLPVLYLFFSGWFLIFPLSLAGAWQLFSDPETKARATPFAIAAVALGASLLVFFVNSRYRLLLLPAMAPFFGAGPMAARQCISQRKKALPCIFFAFFAFMVFANFYLRDQPSEAAEQSVGKALAAAGRTGEALAAFEGLSAKYPFSLDLKNSLALLYIWRGRFAEAAPLVEKLAANPGFAERAAHYRRLMREGLERFGSGGAGVEPSAPFHAFLDARTGEWLAGHPGQYLENGRPAALKHSSR